MAVAAAYSGFLVAGELLGVRTVTRAYKTGAKVGQDYTRYLVEILSGHKVHTVSFSRESDVNEVIGHDAKPRSRVEIPVMLEASKDRIFLTGFVPRQ
jgi:hypothetical protein